MERVSFIYRMLPGESHYDRLKRLVDAGAPRSKILFRCHTSREKMVEMGLGFTPKYPTRRKLKPEPPKDPLIGRTCWLEPVGLVHLVDRAGKGTWLVKNRYGEHVLAKSSELKVMTNV